MSNKLEQRLNAVPVVMHEHINNERNDSDNKVFMSARHPELFNLKINKEACEILDLCDGERNLNSILDIMSSNYSNVERSVLENDLLEFLFTMWRVGIVAWTVVNPYSSIFTYNNNEGFEFKLLSEEEVLHLMSSRKGELKSPCLFARSFIENSTSICNRVFTGTETFFSISEGENSGYMSLSLLPDGRQSISMNIYELDREVFKVPQILEFIDWSINKYSDLLNKRFTRVDINVQEEEWDNLPIELGFTQIGTMSKAIVVNSEAKDVQVYSKNLI